MQFEAATQPAPAETQQEVNGIPIAEIRSSLDRILASRVFVHSHRIRRFLQFVVEESLTGQHHRLKEYLIGLEVFNRREAFDPRVDSIVRVEARRLRAKVEEYYLTEGREDDLRILLRKGSYVPVFEYRRNSSGFGASGLLHSKRRSIAFAPITVHNNGGDHSALLKEITRRFTHILVKEGQFQVLPQSSREARVSHDPLSAAIQPINAPRPDFIIEGSIEITGTRHRVIIQLLNLIDVSYVWSESVECEIDDYGPIEELGRLLNRELTMPQGEGERAKLHGDNKQSYDSYLQGRYHWKMATPESIRASVGLFQKAVDSNSSYGAAWAALSQALSASLILGLIDPSESKTMKSAAEKACVLNPGLPEAHVSMGAALSLLDWDWPAGEQELQRAIQLDPRDPSTRIAYSIQLACRGQHSAALHDIEQALELDPASLFANFVLGWLLMVSGQQDDAIAQHRLVTKLAPDFALSYLGLGWAHMAKKQFGEAIANFTSAANLLKSRTLLRGCLGYCYAVSNRRDEALRELAHLNNSQPQLASLASFAAIYAGLGDTDRALLYLEQAVTVRDCSLPLLLLGPEFESLREEPRFMNLRERLGVQARQ